MSQPPAPTPSAAARTVRCPACGGPSRFAPDNPHRPFCSPRCQLQDLGDWANERHRVPTPDSDGHDADAPDTTH